MPVLEAAQYVLAEKDIEILITKDSGTGGQHRNKTESCVIMRHKPTGIEAKSSTKCQHRNRELARQMLESRVTALFAARQQSLTASKRKDMVGSGMRGDKVRTYRTRDDQVTDHRNNAKMSLRKLLAGGLEDVWR